MKYLSGFIVLILGLLFSQFVVHADQSSMRVYSDAYPPQDNFTPVPTAATNSGQAIDYISRSYSIPSSQLRVASERIIHMRYLSKTFNFVTVLHSGKDGGVYKVAIDMQNGEVNSNVRDIRNLEYQAQKAAIGNLDPTLSEMISGVKEECLLPVGIWIRATNQNSLLDQQEIINNSLQESYALVHTENNAGKSLFGANNSILSTEISQEYLQELRRVMRDRVSPVLDELTKKGYKAEPSNGMPFIIALMDKNAIMSLTKRDEISVIYYLDATMQEMMDVANASNDVDDVWNRGYSGYGELLAILEGGNISTENHYLNVIDSLTTSYGMTDHATRVASCAAGTHSQFTGVAYGASLLSAATGGTAAGIVPAINWIMSKNARIVNYSVGNTENTSLTWTDHVFDYWARAGNLFISVASGNSGGFVGSPGKAWNVLTVGAFDDFDTIPWGDDIIWSSSSYINPTPFYDREKPEVVASGVDIMSVGAWDIIDDPNGTSFAAPQVAGLTALLVQRNSNLLYWPEASRAIIMASSVHNLEGPSWIHDNGQDLRDGNGGINADLAFQIAQYRETSSSPCYSSCWRGESLNPTTFPENTQINRDLFIWEKGLVRVSISWWANADTPANNYSYSGLDTDFDIAIKGPNGEFINNVASYGWDNNYENLQFFASEPGTYQIVIHNNYMDGSNYLGLAYLFIPMPHSVYLPSILDSYE